MRVKFGPHFGDGAVALVSVVGMRKLVPRIEHRTHATTRKSQDRAGRGNWGSSDTPRLAHQGLSSSRFTARANTTLGGSSVRPSEPRHPPHQLRATHTWRLTVS